MPTQWGNYSDYTGPATPAASAIHLPDPRLRLITTDLVPHLFAAKHCLDIGSNAGGVSCELAFDYHAASVAGVDIDPNLVAQANKLLALRASRARPPTKHADRIVDWFPLSAVLKHGYIHHPFNPEPNFSTTAPPSAPWPRVTFHATDWAIGHQLSGPYDVIVAFSVSTYHAFLHALPPPTNNRIQVIKWIHLEHLDQGLATFFQKCAAALSPAGHLVIELQGWDSYEKAVRPQKAPHFMENFKQLHYRPETSFDHLLADQGLDLCASSSALPRTIKVYRKR
ncbi:hypothetical protein ACEQ8H_002760 [Pleosporales sp. CAS-2024a]